MQQAYDVLLQLPVYADAVAESKIDEPFRYECLCCGEEVYIAAAGSSKRSAHFRHRRGNSDKDCELYLGTVGITGAVNAAKARQHSRADIYFDYSQKLFFVSFSFSAEKLEEYATNSCILEFKAGFKSPPYERIRINRQNFPPDSTVQLPLQLTSNDCFLSITNSSIQYHCQLLGENDFPTFFRIANTGLQSSRGKRIVNGKIYTAVSYYALAKKRNDLTKLKNYNPLVSISPIEEIDALGTTIFGAFIEIYSITSELRDLFEYFNYELVTSEEVALFWPPSWSENGITCIGQKTMFISSSFELVANSNISCDSSCLNQKQGVYEIDVAEPVSIRFNNIDSSYAYRLPRIEISNKVIEQVENTVVKVSDEDVCFVINSCGYSELSEGKHRLSLSDRAVKYRGNYPIFSCSYPQKPQKSRVAILHDILTYYRATIPFEESLVLGYPLSTVARTYIEECKVLKQINIRALEYIKAGKI